MQAMDVVESRDGYVVKADLPGVVQDRLHVSVRDNVLTIEAETSAERSEKDGETVIRTECRSGKYRRTVNSARSMSLRFRPCIATVF